MLTAGYMIFAFFRPGTGYAYPNMTEPVPGFNGRG